MLNAIPAPIRVNLERSGLTLSDFSFVGGGCINHGGKIVTAKGAFFLKWNDSKKYPAMFKTESTGLELLGSARAIRIPKAILTSDDGQYQFLLLEYINSAKRSEKFWTEFGSSLARLHQSGSRTFGLEHENYIGSLKQANDQTASWVEFFVQSRLSPQVKLGRDKGLIDQKTLREFDSLYKRLPDLVPEEKPSLLHGDLWSGNLMTDEKGSPCLIDPAVYYGHREVDLAMTQLFGGFDNSFLEAYCDVYPLLGGFTERFELYNLYPILVHVNLFGKSYLPQLVSSLRTFV
jgi:protein-ribulosamine 3-kinase